jgi:hypothetical protein
VAFLPRDGRTQDPSRPQMHPRSDLRSLLFHCGPITAEHQTCTNGRSESPLNSSSSDTPRILFL